MLRNGTADVAFVRGGSADVVADEEAGPSSLGSLFYEPLWIFYRSDAARTVNRKTGTLESIAQLKGLRVNVDKPGSGVPEIMERMLRANHLDASALQLSNLEQTPATEALQAGLLDVIVPRAGTAVAAGAAAAARTGHRPDGLGAERGVFAPLPFLHSRDAAARRRRPGEATCRRSDVVAGRPPHSLLAREETHPPCARYSRRAPQTRHSDAAGSTARATSQHPHQRAGMPLEGDRAINGTPLSLAALPAFLGQQPVRTHGGARRGAREKRGQTKSMGSVARRC